MLWTRRPLTAGDQEWLNGLTTEMQLHQWTSADVEDHLSGDAEVLRSTYFGELVLTPAALADIHTRASAPIRQRWQPEVHQTVDAERAVRRMLGEAPAWGNLGELAARLASEVTLVESDRADLPEVLASVVGRMTLFACTAVEALTDVPTALDRGDMDLVRQRLAGNPGTPDPDLFELPHLLRSGRYRAAPTVTNTLADSQVAVRLLEQVDSFLGRRLVAVLADAGYGKTQLAAQLTSATADRPAGVLLHGRDLQAGQSLDDVAGHVVCQGIPVASMEALVAAVDAAGQRARRRLPIIIDGLNEAEDPRDWRGLLASLDEVLRKYPYVLVVCTLRGAFADEALPQEVPTLRISGFEHDVRKAVRRYFSYYRINPADAELPWKMLNHPLTLRLFCEVTNPSRERVVGIEAMPGSLTALFDRYLKQTAERIAELAPRSRRYYEQEVRAALDEIGLALWEENARTLNMRGLRRRLDDEGRPWNESLVRALEQDGILLRLPSDTPGEDHFAAIYDALAGHLIANAILGYQGRAGFEGWLNTTATVSALAGEPPDRHPLADDVFQAFVGLVPRRLYRQQLWPLLSEPLRTQALISAAHLEGNYIDAQTVEALTARASERGPHLSRLFNRMWQTRGSWAHPLNARFLNSVLEPMGVADRDLGWTEWIRENRERLVEDLCALEEGWRSRMERPDSARLRARWVMWTLTSTVREVRDRATRALYWFGRGDPEALFSLTLDSLAVNDPYVSERLLAASYGLVMARQAYDPGITAPLATFLSGLRDALIGVNATHPTYHWLARLYVQGIVTLANAAQPSAVPQGLGADQPLRFAPGPAVVAIGRQDQRASEARNALHMDFENYTLGRLFQDRHNYDADHPGHIAAVAHVLGTIWGLGWREAELGAVDNEFSRQGARGDREPTERYGKKYGWIGFYTYAGMLSDSGVLSPERLSDLQVDPSFPDQLRPASIPLETWVRPTPVDAHRWVRHGIVKIPDELLYRQEVCGEEGPWIAVYGDLSSSSSGDAAGRRVFGLLTAMLVDPRDASRLVDKLTTEVHLSNHWLPRVPSDYYTFAGEIPWSSWFAQETGDAPRGLYHTSILARDGPGIDVEVLAHRFAWESYHSPLNNAGGAIVPSKLFSARFNLRGIPQKFDQVLADGGAAALSLAAPAGFGGQLLYLRQDLLYQYAAGRRLVLFIWGQRQLVPHPRQHDSWLSKARQSGADVWRYIRTAEELSPAFAGGQVPPAGEGR
ncbi:MAG: NACHT domain-containing protein [Symbiobacteriia bacterium]